MAISMVHLSAMHEGLLLGRNIAHDVDFIQVRLFVVHETVESVDSTPQSQANLALG